jgi:F-type H+-transporting ATPase subunit epsilon
MNPKDKIKLQLVTPEKVVLEKEVDEAIIPTQEGLVGILPNHAPLISLLKPGAMILRNDGQEQLLAVATGSLEVLNKRIIILADSAERAEDIDVDEAEKARQEAEKLMKMRPPEGVDYAALMAKIEKDLAWAAVARKRKYRNLPK